MPTLHVSAQIYMNKKKHTKFIKITYISLLFRSFANEALSESLLLKRREIFVILINLMCVYFWDPHYEAPDNLQVGHVECVSPTISWPLYVTSRFTGVIS